MYGDERKHYLEDGLRAREGFLKVQRPKTWLSTDGQVEDVGAKSSFCLRRQEGMDPFTFLAVVVAMNTSCLHLLLWELPDGQPQLLSFWVHSCIPAEAMIPTGGS